jgi:outer membrane protein assembly factor BamE (lipoprotein component of BamABCDE complex)
MELLSLANTKLLVILFFSAWMLTLQCMYYIDDSHEGAVVIWM